MIARRHAFALGLALAGWTTQAPAKPTFIEIDAPGAGTIPGAGTQINGVNAKGDVTGLYYDNSRDVHGFVRTPDGTFVSYDISDSAVSPLAIDSKGRTAGIYRQEAFFAEADGTTTVFDPTDPPSDAIARAISDKGVVAGDFAGDDSLEHGFLRKARGRITMFDIPGAGITQSDGTYVYGINADGYVAGYVLNDNNAHGYLRAPNGGSTPIDVPGAGSGSRQGTMIFCINVDNTVGGTVIDTSEVLHAFLRTADGTIVIFDGKNASTSPSEGTFVMGLNAKGIAVGTYLDRKNIFHGFERSKTGHIAKIDGPGAGTTNNFFPGTFSTGINQRGVIVGYTQDNAGVYHGYIRTP
jgi:hypothetical protein